MKFFKGFGIKSTFDLSPDLNLLYIALYHAFNDIYRLYNTSYKVNLLIYTL